VKTIKLKRYHILLNIKSSLGAIIDKNIKNIADNSAVEQAVINIPLFI
jgi:hypothetical protein